MSNIDEVNVYEYNGENINTFVDILIHMNYFKITKY